MAGSPTLCLRPSLSQGISQRQLSRRCAIYFSLHRFYFFLNVLFLTSVITSEILQGLQDAGVPLHPAPLPATRGEKRTCGGSLTCSRGRE